MRLSVVVFIENISVIDWHFSLLLLRQLTILILIDLNLALDILESTSIHLGGCHETTHFVLEL